LEVDAPAGGFSDTEFTVEPARFVVPQGRLVALTQASFGGGGGGVELKVIFKLKVPHAGVGQVSMNR
jgi:hypothetical protein